MYNYYIEGRLIVFTSKSVSEVYTYDAEKQEKVKNI